MNLRGCTFKPDGRGMNNNQC